MVGGLSYDVHVGRYTMTTENIEVNERSGWLKALFVITGIEYYMVARFAGLEHLVNVGGNLFHHAVEMMLKAGLTHKYGLKALKEKFNHNVPKLWEEFKAEVDAGLDRFDETIDDLHKFEDIRYPDITFKKGSNISVGLHRFSGQATDGRGKPRPEPRYHLSIKEVDDLMAAIFKAASINDRAFFPGAFSSAVRHYLYKHNEAFKEGGAAREDLKCVTDPRKETP